MNGFKNRSGEVYQNENRSSISWYHHEVKEGQIFGRYKGTPFVTDPYISESGFMPIYIRTVQVYPNGCKNVKWVFEHPVDIVKLICLAHKAGKARLFDWKSHVDGLTLIHCINKSIREEERLIQKKIREERSDLNRAARNDSISGKKVSHRTKAFQKNVGASNEYIDASRKLYGDSVEINRKNRVMTAGIASYMDGIFK